MNLFPVINNSRLDLFTAEPLQQCAENVAWKWFLVSLNEIVNSFTNLQQMQSTTHFDDCTKLRTMSQLPTKQHVTCF